MTVIGLYATNGMNPATGYGKLEAGLLRGMREAGLFVSPVVIGNGAQSSEPIDLALLVGSPEWATKYPKARRLWLYTMSESTQVSNRWVTLINKHFERVLVPCPPLVDVYQNSGVRVPVHYVPMGVDFCEIDFVERTPEPEVFTWLTYSLGDQRKGADLVIMAFDRLFRGDKRHRLLIKCRDSRQWLTGLNNPQIEVIDGQLDEAEWHALMARCHAFVFPSRGEGFGLPPREAALSGMPVIATEWLGLWDINEWGRMLPVKDMRPAQFDFWEANEQGAKWAEPDHVALDRAMLDVFYHYRMALHYAQRGRRYLLGNFCWKYSGEAIQRLLWMH